MSTTAVTPSAVAAAAPGVRRRRGQGVVGAFLHNPTATACSIVILVLAAIALFAPLVAPNDPNATDLLAVYQSPSRTHWMGTDQLGRDQLSRLIFGARTSMLAGVEAVGISLILGVPAGLAAGYLGGKVDAVASRINDALMSVPNLILALAMIAALGPGLFNAMLAIGIVFTPRVYRVVRASAIDVRSRTFVEALEALGLSRTRLLVVHILPNSLSPLLVVISISLGSAVLAEASMSFLGLGVRPPTSSWGGMLSLAAQRMDLMYLAVPPGVAIFITVAAFTFLGDAVRDVISSRKGGRGG